MTLPAAAIAGATGLTGQHVLNRLLDGGGFDPVIAVLRKPLHRSHPRLQERVGDLSQLDSVPAPELRAAFCCLGTTIRKAGSKDAFRQINQGYVLRFARWARAHGAIHFSYLSSVSAALNSPNFYLQVKGETESELENIGFPSLDIFQPSFLLGARPESRPLERFAQGAVQVLKFALIGALEPYRGIPAQEVATAMLIRAEAVVLGVHRHEWASIRALAGATSKETLAR